jgi:hypothetical protein
VRVGSGEDVISFFSCSVANVDGERFTSHHGQSLSSAIIDNGMSRTTARFSSVFKEHPV